MTPLITCVKQRGFQHRLHTLGANVLQRSGHASYQRQAQQKSTTSGAEVSPDVQTPPISLQVPTYCIWGANTGVGKTLISAGLARASVAAQDKLLYVKPLQTGYPVDSDARFVAHVCATAPGLQHHVQNLNPPGASSSTHHAVGSSSFKTLYAWRQPISPHIAAATEGWTVTDAQVVAATAAELGAFTFQDAASSSGSSSDRFVMVETAGGVASPGASGNLQCDILRPMRLPAVLVGDHRLGGISATISAYESLLLRGYDVEAVVLMSDDRLGNAAAISQHFERAAHQLGRTTNIVSLPLCLPPSGPPPAAQQQDPEAVHLDSELLSWLQQSGPHFQQLLQHLKARHQQRLLQLQTAEARAKSTVWWPFTQHSNLGDGAVTVVDARAGEDWHVYRGPASTSDSTSAAASSSSSSSGAAALGGSSGPPMLQPQYDAPSSWWTQMASGQQLQSEVARAVAYAAGRYMHVMFPENAHEPALQVAQKLLDSVGRGWASRVFFSDDGSTAVEVALKMAFRRYMLAHGLQEEEQVQLQVIGIENSYHGDTLGAMDCSPASVYNGRMQSAWYAPRGLFLDPPYLSIVNGRWQLQPPSWLDAGSMPQQETSWKTREAALCPARGTKGRLWDTYQAHIEQQLLQHVAQQREAGRDVRLAACIIEPVLQGAGGMLCVDQLFQRALVDACRKHGIPVIFDEVFTGCWRLGHASGADILGVTPDLGCYAKLLTAGVAPLAVTLASQEVFDSFGGPSKVQALLHGHSYTAYPLGCTAAATSLDILQSAKLNPNLCTPEVPGRCQSAGQPCEKPCGRLLPLWDEPRVQAVSKLPQVKRALVLGTVLAVEIDPARMPGAGTAGYTSGAAAGLAAQLRQDGVYVRPLGSLLYLMCTPTSSRARCDQLLGRLEALLQQGGPPVRQRGGRASPRAALPVEQAIC